VINKSNTYLVMPGHIFGVPKLRLIWT